MATVWLAERHDGLIPRPVALKLPKRSWRKAALRERLTGERDILASLTHPNIARLYDAGITVDGQPYLASSPPSRTNSSRRRPSTSI